mgnify:FL=1
MPVVGLVFCYTEFMISLLVSSKTMVAHLSDYELPETTPQFLSEAIQLHATLSKLSVKQIASLMHLSPKLAATTHERIRYWNPVDGTPAWYTFVGDVYKGLKIHEFNKEDILFAQHHMATISGLYGLVRPLDTIHPYRLELMYKLKGKGFANLYEFWGDKIARQIPRNEPVINLASEEYIKLLRPYLPDEQIITPWFMQTKNGEPDFQVIHAKIARGAMARWIAQNRINNAAELKKFNYNGYSFMPERSTLTKPVFTRPEGYDFKADY